MPGPNEAWEKVLAAVEADARRAAALLHAPLAEADVPPPSDPLAVPADWVLPGAPPELPALSEMPPVPPELRDRIESLRAQIDELQGQLAAALREWQQPKRMVLAGAPAQPPVYVDRRV